MLADLGGLYLRMNLPADAISALCESLKLSEQTKDPPLRASTLLGMAEAYSRSVSMPDQWKASTRLCKLRGPCI